MTKELIQARVTAFAIEAFTILAVAVLGALASPEFAEVVAAHFGDGVAGSLVLLLITGAVKHARNLIAIKDADELGGFDGRKAVVLV